jgi:hypothetical protein
MGTAVLQTKNTTKRTKDIVQNTQRRKVQAPCRPRISNFLMMLCNWAAVKLLTLPTQCSVQQEESLAFLHDALDMLKSQHSDEGVRYMVSQEQCAELPFGFACRRLSALNDNLNEADWDWQSKLL